MTAGGAQSSVAALDRPPSGPETPWTAAGAQMPSGSIARGAWGAGVHAQRACPHAASGPAPGARIAAAARKWASRAPGTRIQQTVHLVRAKSLMDQLAQTFGADRRPRRPGRLAPSMRVRPVAQLPRHALQDKGLQKQKGVGPLVNSRDRRAAFVPLINRSSTDRQSPVVFRDSVYLGFLLFVLPKRRQGRLSSVLWKSKWKVVPWGHRSALARSRLRVPPRPAPPPCRAPLCLAPPVGCPGFGFDRCPCSAFPMCSENKRIRQGLMIGEPSSARTHAAHPSMLTKNRLQDLDHQLDLRLFPPVTPTQPYE